MPAPLLADTVLIAHFLFMIVVVLSVPLVMIGGWRGWRWVRNPYYRFAHLGMIAFVAAESLIGMRCPLTVWESSLRNLQEYDDGGFIATWFSRLLFYHFPSWVFTVAYVSFALLVASLFYFVPVRRKRD